MTTMNDCVPSLLVKAFQKFQYAQDFANGNIRFSTLAYYRNISDPDRRDVTEGCGEVHVDRDAPVLKPADVSAHTGIESIRVRTRPDQRYVCCLSIPDAISIPSLKEAFGRNFIVVHSPVDFIRDVQQALLHDALLANQGVEFDHGIVRYDKSEYVGSVHREDEISNLAWQQKPRDYANEREYRLCFRLTTPLQGEQPSHLVIRTGFALPYCETITVG